MEIKYYEIFKLRYEKLINATSVIYKTMASYNEMAFSLKKLMKETEIFVQSFLIYKSIVFNNLSIDLLRQLEDVCKYVSIYKIFKLKKVKEIDSFVISKMKDEVLNNIKNKPLFIIMAVYFDKTVSKLKVDESIEMTNIIVESFQYMCALLDNQDDLNTDLKIYDDVIKIVMNHIDGE